MLPAMKVALVVKDFEEARGGLERHAVLLARGLSAMGVDVHVFSNTREEEQGIVFHHVPCMRWSSLLKVMTFPLFAGREIGKGDWDVVYGLTPLFAQDVYRVGEGLHRDVLRFRHPDPLKRLSRYANPKHLAVLWIEARMLRSRGRLLVITNSEMMKERVVSLYGVEPERVRVVYNGFDDKRFNEGARAHRAAVRKELSIADDEPVVVFASNDFERKGLLSLLEAIALLSGAGERVRVLVAGRGDVGRFERKAADLSIGELVSFVGPRKDIERYYGASDMMVLPTLYDPFSNACLEAMAVGLPVITTARNGAAEIITDGVDGFVIKDPADAGALAQRIKGLLSIGDAGANALRKAALYTMGRNIEKTMDVLRQAADAKARA